MTTDNKESLNRPKFSLTDLGKKIFIPRKWQWGLIFFGVVMGITMWSKFDESKGTFIRVVYFLSAPTIIYIFTVIFNIGLQLITSVIKSIVKKDN